MVPSLVVFAELKFQSERSKCGQVQNWQICVFWVVTTSKFSPVLSYDEVQNLFKFCIETNPNVVKFLAETELECGEARVHIFS